MSKISRSLVLMLTEDFKSTFTEKELRSTLLVREGMLPIVLTVPHDGRFTRIGERILSPAEGIVSNTEPRDLAVRAIARDVYLQILGSQQEAPNLIIELIEREYRTLEIQRYFEQTAVRLLNKVIPLKDKPKLLFDLHGFSVQPAFGKFDLILGTDHRKSVGDSNVDQQFAEFMRTKGYEVYLPTQEIVDGERFSASGSKSQNQIVPLVQEIMAAGLANTVSMQLEIAWHFRQAGAKEEGMKLSKEILVNLLLAMYLEDDN